MKKRLLALLAALLLTACPALAEEHDLQAEALSAYAAVLLEGAPCVPMDAADRALADCAPLRFTVLDMDGDDVSEVILEVSAPEGYIILTRHDGVVYSAEVVYRALLDLKDDGTYTYSSGASDSGVGHMSFLPDADSGALTGVVRYTDEVSTDADEAAYAALLAAQAAKLSALWYDFTEENIRLLLAA